MRGGSDAALFVVQCGLELRRHCESTGRANARQMTGFREAIHRDTKKDWIASSLSLLAMTARRARAGSTDRAALHARWQRQVAVHRHVPDFLRIFADGAVG